MPLKRLCWLSPPRMVGRVEQHHHRDLRQPITLCRNMSRSDSLPTAEIDGAERSDVVWSDCRFEQRCSANDLSSPPQPTAQPRRGTPSFPLRLSAVGLYHFISGLAVDKTTSEATRDLGLLSHPDTRCNSSTCKLDVGLSPPSTGGARGGATSWPTHDTDLAGEHNSRFMVGDYILPHSPMERRPPGSSSCQPKSGNTLSMKRRSIHKWPGTSSW